MIVQTLKNFLRALSLAIPTNPGARHMFMFGEFPPNVGRLCLHVQSLSGRVVTVWLDDADFEKPIPVLVREVQAHVYAALAVQAACQ